ncbi:Putative NADPH-quinone reductase (modulator of drug activity B) [Chelatococcus sambhunathii]|uniref:NAD(P)H dehydrogenase n=2 Tax=Chelatococcus TaxID=28209 RepID=A0AAC9JQM5_9HYPH|nr:MULTISPECIES: NAD(P)H-dependent oxidoreductase [Chelatococcus]APF38403.1 NAD(P)H dehydrogenase [Chelatococcus daeguensis]CUA84956.1 Putative NADPH-quinone reductase (modulator of drug activity B) [Chelatococcus sambhunathii]
MRILLVYCHPCADSFTAAVRDTALSALSGRGHDVHLLDLYAEGFDPVMSADERRGYHTPGTNEEPVAGHLALLRWAEGLVFVHPTWWYGPPAMLKGWLDRVFVPHATFRMPERGKTTLGTMGHIRFLAVVSTLGSPRWWWWFMGMPGRRMLLTGIGALCGLRCKRLWLGLHGMDTVTADERRRFLARVSRVLGRV